ncbi:hypothetical protein KSP40_PGU003670 [Platanthera guangdongensis]|uniref:Uncharacterized protein n=1 Tax=Platanthera guangdongensis TaxID=2320717 RepID=A0ABR2MUY4_9ASPA
MGDHPLLRALDFCRFPRYPAALNQVLVQLLVAGILFHPLAAGRALLALFLSPPPPLLLSPSSSFSPHPDAFASNTLIRSLLAAGLPDAASPSMASSFFPPPLSLIISPFLFS